MTVTDMHVCDLIGSINKNLEAGNITFDDADKLRQLTHMLYRHLYSHYEEMEAVNDMTDESLILDVDIYMEKLEQAGKREQQLIEREQQLIEREQQHIEREQQLQETVARQESLLEQLRQELAELKSRQI